MEKKHKIAFGLIIFLGIAFLGLHIYSDLQDDVNREDIVAGTYFVDNSIGSDENPGNNSNKPWKTLNKVNRYNFPPNSTILFRKGRTWEGGMEFYSSGKANAPIKLGAYGVGNRPIIKGQKYGIRLWDANFYVIENLDIREYSLISF